MIGKREKITPEIIATGNCCNNPCYEYQSKLFSTCPKCGGKVNKDYENGYTVKTEYNNVKGQNYDKKIYDENVCSKFTFNNKIDKIDYNINELFNYFVKVDPQTNNEYMIIDGERFDSPTGLPLFFFLTMNHESFFDKLEGARNTIWLSKDNSKIELGKATGFYDKVRGKFEVKYCHMVHLFTCSKCGYKYHIINTSPLRLRDKTKDNVVG